MSLRWYLCLLSLCTIIGVENVTCTKKIDPADDPKNIEKLCPNGGMEKKRECVKKYFEEHSDCQRVDEPPPDPLTLEKYTIKYSNANVTLTLNKVRIYGLEICKVYNFYRNNATKRIVLAVQTETLRLESDDGDMEYNRKGVEPILRKDRVGCQYGVTTMTISFPSDCKLDLNKATVSTYAEDGNPAYVFGPNMRNTSDPVAKKAYKELTKALPFAIRNEFAWQDTLFAKLLIQKRLCKFDNEKSPPHVMEITNGVSIL